MADTTLKMVLLGEDRTASKALKGVGTEAEKTAKKASAASSAFKGAMGGAMVTGAVSAITSFGKQSVEAFSQVEDATAAASTIYGKNMDAIIKQSETANTKLGMTKAQVIEAANTFGTMGKSAGLSGKDLAGFSTQMTALGGDMASFRGTSPEEAITAIGAALRGETEPIRKYGVMLDDASMRNEAMRLGLTKTTKDALTPQQKVLAAQSLILKQTTLAQGDFARTADSTANAQKTATAKYADAQAMIGQKLAPAMTKLTVVASQVLDFITRNVDVLGPLAVGITGAAVAMGVLNAVMALNPIGLVVIAIAALTTGLVVAYEKSETFRKVMDAAFGAVAKAGTWLWNNALQPALKAIVEGFAWVTDGIASMLEALGKVPGFGWAADAAKSLRGLADDARKAADGIRDIPDAEPEITARDRATTAIKSIDARIKSLRGKVVEAKAKGDDKGVRDLQAKIRALQNKRVTIVATLAASGSASWRISGGAGTGSLRAIAVANGGIMRSYAGGGFENHTAMIGNGVTRVWDEPETGGEAYIPLSPSKRPRSLGIWRETGRRLGVALANGGVAGGSAGVPAVTVMASVARGVDPLAFAREVEQELAKLARHRGGRLAFA